MMEQNAVTYPLLEPENQQEEPPDQYYLSEDGSDEEEPTNNELGNVLDEGSFFLVGRSSRFGRTIKINSKLLS